MGNQGKWEPRSSTCHGARTPPSPPRRMYEVPVEVEVNQDILPSVLIDPGHGELVGMASLVLCGVAGLDLGL